MKIILMEPLNISAILLQELSAPLLAAGHQFEALEQRIPYREELISRVRDADVLILGNQELHAAVINECFRLKMISVAFTGVDHVAVDSAQIRKIRVCNAAGYATEAVAELSLGLMLSLLRSIPAADRQVRERGDKTGLFGGELRGRTLGIVGGGAIGSRVAELGRAFGCRLKVWSRSQRPWMAELGAEFVTLDELLSKSDIVSLHLPLTSETRGLIGRRELALMQSGAMLINTARGLVVDNLALAQALQSGRLAGAGVDVFDAEPPLDPAYPLLNCPGVIATPHLAYASREAMEARARIAFANVYQWLAGQPQNIVC